MVTNDSIETKMNKLLAESKIVKHIMMNDVLDDLDSASLLKLLSSPYKIFVTDSGLYYEDENNSVIACPNFGVDISENGKWLSEIIPACPFDIEQGGNIRKSEEAESAYCCAIVCIVLKDEDFSNELKELCLDYNFSEFDSRGSNGSFKSLLDSWLDLQSISINISVSAAKYRISNLKKDTEMFLRDGIPLDEVIGLRELATKIRNINRDYSQGVLSPENVKMLTKIDTLKLLDERSNKVNDLIKNSKHCTLYKLENLSSEYISPSTKKKLIKLARKGIESLCNDPQISGLSIFDKDALFNNWKRRFFKKEKISIRKVKILEYLNDRENFVFPVKL